MSSTSRPSDRSIFSSLTSSSRSSIKSSSSTRSTPLGCRDFRLRYAEDAKHHDLNISYAHATPLSSSPSSRSEATFPLSCWDSLRLRYAKDSKGHGFAWSYPAQFGVLAPEEEQAQLAAAAAVPLSIPVGARDYKRRFDRYSKDGRVWILRGTHRY